MTSQAIKTIEPILTKGDRVEIIPTKDGAKIIQIRSESAKI